MTARRIQDELQISFVAISPCSAVDMIIFEARKMRKKGKVLFKAS